ncbi:MAG: hypothetical protein ACQERM_09765 [Methanobacteriota archaeon]
MRFSRDRRGQSVVVGAVILFGFLILALGVFQVQVVPTDNANVEFEHSQAVEDDFGDLRNNVLRAGSTGSTGSTQVRLGAWYPARTFFVNPPPVSGSLETEPTGEIRVRNASVGDGAHENAREFWNTSPSFETSSLRYDAEYNEFDGAPELVYEHSVVAAEFDDAVLFRTGQTVVSEGRVSLTALTGTVSESGVEPESVDPRAVSASDTTVPLTPTDGKITLELPTAVGNASALADRWTQALPPNATATGNETRGEVQITLDNVSDDRPYRLALSEVSLDASGETEPAYVVPVGPQNVSPDDTVTVEVRDRYNNPVPDVEVSIEGDNRENTTNDEGRVFFKANRTSITATINGTEAQPYEDVSFDASEGGGGSGENRTYDVEWNPSDPTTVLPGDHTFGVTVSDRFSGDPIVNTSIDASFTPVGNEGLPSVTDPIDETNSSGQTTVQFNTNNAESGDSFYLYASAGDDVDRILVNVEDESGMAGAVSPVDGTVSESNIPGEGRRVEFDITADSTVETSGFEVTTQNELSGRSFSDTGTTFGGEEPPTNFEGQITVDLEEFGGSGSLGVSEFVDPESPDADLVVTLNFSDGSSTQIGITT